MVSFIDEQRVESICRVLPIDSPRYFLVEPYALQTELVVH
jgi:hypothetical protein